MHTLDWETEAIVPGSPTPPRPVGLAVRYPNGRKNYLAFGHPSNNNATPEDVEKVLRAVWDKRMLFHHGKFDVRVAMHWFNLPFPSDPLNVHDTLFLAYLDDPRRRTLELKPLADDLLDMPPTEQEELRDWLFENVKGARQAKKNWGKYISKAPGDLVGKYAIGDVDRTHGLYEYFMPIIEEWKMVEAYQREQRLLPVIIDMESNGVRICPSIHEELAKREAEFVKIERYLTGKLGEINFGHGATLYKAMLSADMVDASKVEYTEKGNPRTGREFVSLFCTDRNVVKKLQQRSRLVKVLGTYLRPWAEAQKRDGYFYPYFNQTRGEKGGTRTGRLSSNFQQVPRKPDDAVDVPYLRQYIIPDEGEVIIARDFSSQEIRILAHYAEGRLMEAYRDDPDMDVHDWVRQLIEDIVGLVLKRSPVKQANFLQIYGGGVPALSKNLPCSEDAAKEILTAHRTALPEVKELSEEITGQVKNGTLLRTWGGRLYDVEVGMSKQGKWEKLFYKLINVLVQGSAADQTKELMINYYHAMTAGRIMIQVHDELLASVPRHKALENMCIMRTLMNDSTGWDVPMRSDGKMGESWGEAKPFNDSDCE